MKISKIVNPSKWEEMDGDNELEKRINSFLTTQFIFKDEGPSDECLSEAKKIISMVNKYNNKAKKEVK